MRKSCCNSKFTQDHKCYATFHPCTVFSGLGFKENGMFSSFGLIHSDTREPSIVLNILRSWWFVTFIDDCARILTKAKYWLWVLLSLVLIPWLKTNFEMKIESSMFNDLEITSIKFYNLTLKKKGLHHDSSCINTLCR